MSGKLLVTLFALAFLATPASAQRIQGPSPGAVDRRHIGMTPAICAQDQKKVNRARTVVVPSVERPAFRSRVQAFA
jgi:hypothetical protein